MLLPTYIADGQKEAQLSSCVIRGLERKTMTKDLVEALSTVIVHHGMADASAAEPLKNGRFIIAGDEFNSFQVYDANKSDSCIQEFDFNSFINIKSPKHEADIEASAELDGITYWISSHGRNGKGELKWHRHQFFATRIKDDGTSVSVEQIGDSYTGILIELLRYDWFQELTKERLDPAPNENLAAKSEGAVNIEGLASTKDGLLIGFRNPIVEGKALLVPLKNPEVVVRRGSHPQFGEPIYLDLGGRGIRSIDYWQARNLYIISSGSYDKVKDFDFYTWTGNASDKPRLIDIGERNIVNPEAVVLWPEKNHEFLVVSDDGAEACPGENSPNKDLARDQQEFRTMWVKM